MTEAFIDIDERLDTIPGTDFSLIQKIDGTAFSIDTLLLADFVQFTPEMMTAADLGSGSGILSFLIKYRNKNLQITGFELQKDFYDLSTRNMQINKQFEGLFFESMDIRDIPSRILPESYDLVVSNPPYFQLGNGRLPTNPSRAQARHELNGTVLNFVESASYMLPYGGRFCVVIPISRHEEICKYMAECKFGIKRKEFVIPKEGEEPHLVMLEGEKFYGGKFEEMPSITIHKKDNSFSDELQKLFSAGLKKYS